MKKGIHAVLGGDAARKCVAFGSNAEEKDSHRSMRQNSMDAIACFDCVDIIDTAACRTHLIETNGSARLVCVTCIERNN